LRAKIKYFDIVRASFVSFRAFQNTWEGLDLTITTKVVAITKEQGQIGRVTLVSWAGDPGFL
jgi:hypothetical protein